MSILEVTAEDDRLKACQEQYFKEISIRFNQVFDPYAGEGNAMDKARQWHVVSLDDGNAIGCGSLRDLGKGIAEVKRVWISKDARGQGLAKAIMDWLEDKAGAEGFSAIRLDTNRTLNEAQVMYRKRGYQEINRYNDNPFAHHFFEKIIG